MNLDHWEVRETGDFGLCEMFSGRRPGVFFALKIVSDAYKARHIFRRGRPFLKLPQANSHVYRGEIKWVPQMEH